MTSKVFSFLTVLLVSVIYDPKKTDAAVNDQEILADYFWGSHELRSGRQRRDACDNFMTKVGCFFECGVKYVCDWGSCICLSDESIPTSRGLSKDTSLLKSKYPPKKTDEKTEERQIQVYPYQDNQYLYSNENDWPEALRTAIKEDDDAKKSSSEDSPFFIFNQDAPERPALRHHIAHFCPNLKAARACIRKCMKFGKPAFCGKDHVCYCGHRYSSHDDKTKADAVNIYSQYRDIYEKYFGPQIFDQPESSEEVEKKSKKNKINTEESE